MNAIIDQLASLATRVGFDWFRAKTFLEHSVAFHDDALHVIGGVLVQLIAAALLRRSVASWRPWLAVLALELLNEANDFAIEAWPYVDRPMQWGEGVKDVLLTLALPTVLLVVARRWPGVLSGSDKTDELVFRQ
ncbi:MAG: hypothetical protein ACREBO_09555 [Novosphingobium sp.]